MTFLLRGQNTLRSRSRDGNAFEDGQDKKLNQKFDDLAPDNDVLRDAGDRRGSKFECKLSIFLACIGNAGPLTTLSLNPYSVLIFDDCHLGSLPPPSIDLTRRRNPEPLLIS